MTTSDTGFIDAVGRPIHLGDYVIEPRWFAPHTSESPVGAVAQIVAATPKRIRGIHRRTSLKHPTIQEIGYVEDLAFTHEPKDMYGRLLMPFKIVVVTPFTAYGVMQHHPFRQFSKPRITREAFIAVMTKLPMSERHRQQVLTDTLTWG